MLCHDRQSGLEVTKHSDIQGGRNHCDASKSTRLKSKIYKVRHGQLIYAVYGCGFKVRKAELSAGSVPAEQMSIRDECLKCVESTLYPRLTTYLASFHSLESPLVWDVQFSSIEPKDGYPSSRIGRSCGSLGSSRSCGWGLRLIYTSSIGFQLLGLSLRDNTNRALISYLRGLNSN